MGIVNCFKKTSIVIISSFTLFACGGGGGEEAAPYKAENNTDGVQESKQIVQDIRDLANATRLENNNMRIFANEIDLAKSMATENTETITKALGATVNAITQSASAYKESNNSITEYLYEAKPAILVSITTTGSDVIYSINQEVIIDQTHIQINVSSSNIFSEYNETSGGGGISAAEEQAPEQEFEIITRSTESEFSLSGTVIADATTAIINGGYIYLDGQCEWDESKPYDKICTADLVINLDAEIKQQNINNLSQYSNFKGALHIDFNNYNLQDYSSEYGFNVIGAEDVFIEIKGAFTNQSQESFEASLNIDIDGNEGCFGYLVNYNYDYIEDNFRETCNEEKNEFVDATVTVAFSADLNGISDDIAVLASISRLENNGAISSVTLNYDSKQLIFTYNTNTNEITITNSAGAEIKVIEKKGENGNISGTISYNGEVYAEISSVDYMLKFSYSDGTIESL